MTLPKVKKGDNKADVARPPSNMASNAYLPKTNPTKMGDAKLTVQALSSV